MGMVSLYFPEISILSPELTNLRKESLMKTADSVQILLQTFAAELTASFSLQVKCNPEEQLKTPIAALVAGIGGTLGFQIQTLTEVQEKEIGGRPDMGVMVGGLLTGHIELKAPGKGADPKKLKEAQNKAQWEKFKDLPNLLYTDANEWALYRLGERVGKLV